METAKLVEIVQKGRLTLLGPYKFVVFLQQLRKWTGGLSSVE